MRDTMVDTLRGARVTTLPAPPTVWRMLIRADVAARLEPRPVGLVAAYAEGASADAPDADGYGGGAGGARPDGEDRRADFG